MIRRVVPQGTEWQRVGDQIDAPMKSDGESNFVDRQIRIAQEITGFLESCPCDVFDKIYAGDLLKLFAEVICIDLDRLRHPSERKFFARMFFDELARFPDLRRFRSMVVWRPFLEFMREQHLITSSPANRG